MPRIKSFLKDSHPFLKKEWDGEKNSKDFDTYSTFSHELCWWICDLGHSYDALIANRAKGQGCSFCAGKKVLKGFNDLESQRPDLAKEWDWEKNELGPDQIHAGSHARVFWRCSEGHSWPASISNRNSINNKNGCPYCSGNKILVGFNDLFTRYPLMKDKWDWEKNSKDPFKIFPSSSSYVWLKCSMCGDGWRRKLEIEVKRATTQCQKCSGGISSFEASILEVIQRLYPGEALEINTRNVIGPYEIDIYFPRLKRAIELNGEYWHSDHSLALNGHTSSEDYHQMKKTLARDAGVELAFLWEDDWKKNQTHLIEAIQSFIEEGCIDPDLARLKSRRQYSGPIIGSSLEIEAEIQKWADERSIGCGTRDDGVLVLNERVGIAINVEASSTAELLELKASYAKQKIALFFVYPWTDARRFLMSLTSKLSLDTRKYAARDLILKEVPNDEADSFVAKYHLQGSARGKNKISIALLDGDEILAVQQYAKYRFNPKTSHEDGAWEGLRLCFKHDVHIYGAATRLQKFFETKYKPDSIVSYVDRSYSIGEFKVHQGFKEDSRVSNFYMWVLKDEPHPVRIVDKHGELRKSNDASVKARPVLNPNQVAGSFGKGVGKLFFGGSLGSREELRAKNNGQLVDNESILEALGYVKYYTAGQSRWSKTFAPNPSPVDASSDL